jgi:site-specific recombinase XerC
MLIFDVTRDDIRGFLAEQIKTNSKRTALARHKGLQQFFKHCVNEAELPVSPMTGIEAPKF